jgi:hypothetical protein
MCLVSDISKAFVDAMGKKSFGQGLAGLSADSVDAGKDSTRFTFEKLSFPVILNSRQ